MAIDALLQFEGFGPAPPSLPQERYRNSLAVVASDPQETFAFLSRTYRVVKLAAFTIVAITGALVSFVALDVKVSHWWFDVKLPLYGVALAGIVAVVAFTTVVVALAVLLKDGLSALSFYKNKSKNLEIAVSGLEDLAFCDPITGIPNSNALKREMGKPSQAKRCLILLDLQNFGEINKKYNHWKGDEYLRRFSEMVTISGRRNESLFKRRPLSEQPEKGVPNENREDEVKAFRKNSGGDEFFICLEGTIVDGLGYLTRLQKRAPEFEKMSFDLLGAEHRFGFCAGLIAVARSESFESANKRASECLGLALDENSPLRLYWIDKEVPQVSADSFEKKIVDEAANRFSRQSASSSTRT